jgi:hypothetical protein
MAAAGADSVHLCDVDTNQFFAAPKRSENRGAPTAQIDPRVLFAFSENKN